MHLKRYLPIVALLAAAACGGKSGSANPNGKGDPAAKGGSQSKGGAAGSPGAMDRRNLPVVLGAADVIDVRKGTIESSLGIQGNLTPIEEIVVRARMEGNLVSVAVRAGTSVSAGQVLARFDDATVQGDHESAVADVESARSDLANAQWNADQSADLFKAGAIPERDLRTSQAALVAAKARMAAADSRLKGMSQTLADTRVLAPTSGVVSLRSADPGEHVSRGAALFTVVRSNVLELEATVPARNAGDIAANQAVRFVSDGRDFTGRVARVNPAINPASRALTFYVEVPNVKGEIRANAFATGRVIGKVVPDATLLISSAVRQNPGDPQAFVYAIVNGAVERRTVTLGIVDELAGVSQILEGLAPGDKVIGGNITAVGNGTRVTIVSGESSRAGRDVSPAGTAPTAGAGRTGGQTDTVRSGRTPAGPARSDSGK
ncbi:MAG: Multidrug resistance protein MdtA [Gemmatimonadaceae bacterium]|nr:Multidrug resistance protein MdtA [Gemmatimonadaceae bacterium]